MRRFHTRRTNLCFDFISVYNIFFGVSTIGLSFWLIWLFNMVLGAFVMED